MTEDATTDLVPTDNQSPVLAPQDGLQQERADWRYLIGQAKTVFDSGLLPRSVKSWQQALVLMLTGKELGLGPMTSIRSIYVVDGKPCMSAELMVALVRKSGLGTFAYEQGDGWCRVTGKRTDTGETFSSRWDRERAARAGLDTRDNWIHYEPEMMRHRPEAEVCRALFGDVLCTIYTREELEGQPLVEGPPPESRTEGIKKALGVGEPASEVEEPAAEAPVEAPAEPETAPEAPEPAQPPEIDAEDGPEDGPEGEDEAPAEPQDELAGVRVQLEALRDQDIVAYREVRTRGGFTDRELRTAEGTPAHIVQDVVDALQAFIRDKAGTDSDVDTDSHR